MNSLTFLKVFLAGCLNDSQIACVKPMLDDIEDNLQAGLKLLKSLEEGLPEINLQIAALRFERDCLKAELEKK